MAQVRHGWDDLNTNYVTANSLNVKDTNLSKAIFVAPLTMWIWDIRGCRETISGQIIGMIL
jgi:hypothetical protein